MLIHLGLIKEYLVSFGSLLIELTDYGVNRRELLRDDWRGFVSTLKTFMVVQFRTTKIVEVNLDFTYLHLTPVRKSFFGFLLNFPFF